jgi:tetratricopeptide (TPR) repeat protein
MMTREKLFTRVNFSGLSQGEVEDYVNIASGLSPISGMAEAVHERTDGNPLFVSEVVRLLEQEGVSDDQSWATAIPEGVRDTIGRRLNRLSEECNRVLTTASVIGREFSLDLLDSLIEWADEDRLLDLLEQALSTHVIEEIPKTLGQYRFSHALIKETLSEEMSATRRIRLHARISESLEQLYGPDAQAHADEIIYHLAQAERVLGTDKLLRYSMMAGELALSNYAYEEAEIHFQRVLTTKEGQAMDEETAEAAYGIGRAQAATGETFQFQEAVTSLSRALDFYIELGDVDRAMEVAGHPIHPIVGWNIGLVDMIYKALKLAPPESHDEGHLLARYGLALALEALDYEGAQDVFGRALEIAQRESDPALEMQTLAFAADVDWYHFRFQDSLDKGLRAIELAEQVDDLVSLVTARFYVARAWDFIGNLEQARIHATALLSEAKKLRDNSWLAWAYWISGTLARLEGDWETARNYNEQGLTVAPRDATLLCTRGVLEFENGDFDEGQAHSARLIELMGEIEPGPNHEYACPALGAPVLARISGNLAPLALGESSAASVLGSPLAVPYFTVAANVGLSIIAVMKNDVSAAQVQYDFLKSFPGVQALYISTDRLLGLLAHTMGEFDKSQSHFDDAVNFSRNAGYRPELAWSLSDYADMLVDRQGPTDQYMATALFDESLAISTELNMGPLKERVESRLSVS